MEYSFLRATLKLKRSIGLYLVKKYIPSVLIVVSSFVSFWIPVTAYPARVTLVVTALLALISQQHQSSEVNASYVIAINVWMTVCIAFVFTALIEYAISIAYHENKVDPIENTKNKRYEGRVNPQFELKERAIIRNPSRLTISSIGSEQRQCNRTSGFIEIVKAEDTFRPNNAVDIISRYIFFTSFTLFIIIYVIYISV